MIYIDINISNTVFSHNVLVNTCSYSEAWMYLSLSLVEILYSPHCQYFSIVFMYRICIFFFFFKDFFFSRRNFFWRKKVFFFFFSRKFYGVHIVNTFRLFECIDFTSLTFFGFFISGIFYVQFPFLLLTSKLLFTVSMGKVAQNWWVVEEFCDELWNVQLNGYFWLCFAYSIM